MFVKLSDEPRRAGPFVKRKFRIILVLFSFAAAAAVPTFQLNSFLKIVCGGLGYWRDAVSGFFDSVLGSCLGPFIRW